jgi:aspartate aminotransferase
MPKLSQVLDRFQPSPIAHIFALAIQLEEEGRDIVNLAAGEPDFETHESVCAAAHAAIDEGVTKYTTLDGTNQLKRAIQEKFKRDNGLDYDLDEIVVDGGAKPVLGHILRALLDPGDQVIIPTPCWTSHPGMVHLSSAEPVFVPGPEDQGFKLQPNDLEAAMTAKTKALILCSPSNPTGAVYDASELRALAEVLLRHEDVWVVSDDIYEKMIYDGRTFATPAQAEPRLKDRVITVNGVSKGYSMTGWRIGFAGGPRQAMAGVKKVMSQATGCASSISQVAATAALTGPQDYIAERNAIFQQRRDLVVRALNQVEGLSVRPCEGAFFLYVNCGGVLGKTTPAGVRLETSADLARYLLEEKGVALVPGAAFEYDPYVRLSFAASSETLEDACVRIRGACAALT